MIRVKALGVARRLMRDSVEVGLGEGATVQDLLKQLPREVSEMAARSELSIMVGGADISAREGLATRLREGDEVTLLPFAHGGRP